MEKDFVFSKKGITLDFLIYVLASENTASDTGIQGFFFQNTPEFYDESITKNYRSDALMLENINFYFENQYDENQKLEIIEYATDAWEHYYAREIHSQQSISILKDDFTDDYFEYINRFINIDEIIKSSKTIKFEIVENFNNFYNKSEIKRLTDCINILGRKHYSEKYGISDLDKEYIIEENQLDDYFEQFLSLKSIDPKLFISYYASLFLYLWENGENLYFNYIKKTRGQFHSPMLSEVSSKIRFVENMIKINENLFFEHSFDTPQLDGYFDENNRFNTTIYDSVWNYLNTIYYSAFYTYSMINGINPYIFKSFKPEHSLYGVKLKFLNRTLTNKGKDDENLLINFDNFKNENKDFIKFLNKKDFTNIEIESILNILSENKYTELGIKSFNISRDIYFFRFCYFFYVFDYFSEKENIHFDTISSFTRIVKFNIQNSRETKQQYLKNYTNINNPSNKDYPFANSRTNIFLAEIESTLKINREKLKAIQSSKKY
ncbi:hypothetical protein [Elizabethkingia meningoseptica]|uniref:hypothetical protein n=1 Tax=Elizabethkingia meningoseptica TaxID=238 RepID=UPI000935A807|nr:hypothetical protein [Elizabethkingia meningoseptica]